ncbi:hypothetical protein HK101_006912, partial [Irineochytrium annulatum]
QKPRRRFHAKIPRPNDPQGLNPFTPMGALSQILGSIRVQEWISLPRSLWYPSATEPISRGAVMNNQLPPYPFGLGNNPRSPNGSDSTNLPADMYHDRHFTGQPASSPSLTSISADRYSVSPSLANLHPGQTNAQLANNVRLESNSSGQQLFAVNSAIQQQFIPNTAMMIASPLNASGMGFHPQASQIQSQQQLLNHQQQLLQQEHQRQLQQMQRLQHQQQQELLQRQQQLQQQHDAMANAAASEQMNAILMQNILASNNGMSSMQPNFTAVAPVGVSTGAGGGNELLEFLKLSNQAGNSGTMSSPAFSNLSATDDHQSPIATVDARRQQELLWQYQRKVAVNEVGAVGGFMQSGPNAFVGSGAVGFNGGGVGFGRNSMPLSSSVVSGSLHIGHDAHVFTPVLANREPMSPGSWQSTPPVTPMMSNVLYQTQNFAPTPKNTVLDLQPVAPSSLDSSSSYTPIFTLQPSAVTQNATWNPSNNNLAPQNFGNVGMSGSMPISTISPAFASQQIATPVISSQPFSSPGPTSSPFVLANPATVISVPTTTAGTSQPGTTTSAEESAGQSWVNMQSELDVLTQMLEEEEDDLDEDNVRCLPVCGDYTIGVPCKVDGEVHGISSKSHHLFVQALAVLGTTDPHQLHTSYSHNHTAQASVAAAQLHRNQPPASPAPSLPSVSSSFKCELDAPSGPDTPSSTASGPSKSSPTPPPTGPTLSKSVGPRSNRAKSNSSSASATASTAAATSTPAAAVALQPPVPPPEDLSHYPLNLSESTPRESASCRVCAVQLCALILHGDADEIKRPHGHDITCTSCYAATSGADATTVAAAVESASQPAVHSRGRKKRVNVVGRDRAVRCEACGHCVGFGGVRMTNGDERDSGWVEPDFGVEVVCARCVVDFNFCSNCGGGGTWRTGKWRPRQLFPPKRRTCRLSHLRIGDNLQVQVVTYRTPYLPSAYLKTLQSNPTIQDPLLTWDSAPRVSGELSRSAPIPHLDAANGRVVLERTLNDLLDITCEIFWSQAANPAVMRVVPDLWTWEKIETRRSTSWGEVEKFVFGKHEVRDGYAREEEEGEVCRRFVAVVHIEKAKTKKKASGKASGLQVEEKDIATPFSPKSKSKKGVATAAAATAAATSATNAARAGSDNADWWFVSKRHVALSHVHLMGPNNVAADQSTLTKMLHALFRRVEADLAADPTLPTPHHFWSPIRKSLNGHLSHHDSMCGRMGLLRLETYCERFGQDAGELKGILVPRLQDSDWFRENFDVCVMRFEDRAYGENRSASNNGLTKVL